MPHNLSRRQYEVLTALQKFAELNGYMPSVRELSGALNLSPATTQQHLVALRRKGYLEIDGTAHGLRLLEREGQLRDGLESDELSPEGLDGESLEPLSREALGLERAAAASPRRRLELVAPPSLEVAPTVPIPVVGNIAAGSPIEAIELVEQHFPLPQGMARDGDYMLHVRGSSMIEDGIFDGDLVVIRPQSTVANGEVAVGLLQDGTATLKRIYREGERIRLQPANHTMAPIYVDRLHIQGKVIGLIRMYRNS